MSDPTVVTSSVLREWPLPEVDDGEGKDDRGTIVVIGGASDTPGAVLLAGLAALRVGAGRLTIATVESTAATLAVAVPESAVQALPAERDGVLGSSAVATARDVVQGADAVVLGPGMRDPDATRSFVAGLLPALPDDAVIVLDALALTCGALDPSAHRGGLVLTPNSSEAARLLGDDGDAQDDDAAAALASRFDAVVALRSRVAAPDGRRWVDGSGNSGLGTSGSGDVLAGAVAGLAARGADPAQATVWGVHLHAGAGERLAARVGRLGFLARELLDELPRLLGELDA